MIWVLLQSESPWQRNDGGTEEKSTHTTHIRGGT